MAHTPASAPADTVPGTPQGMLTVLTAAAFVIFAQVFMVAPILPALARAFATAPGVVGLAVPAYLIPYGTMTLVWGPISDRIGRRPVIIWSLTAFTVLTGLTALAPTAGVFLGLRMATAVGASGVVPISLALIGDQVPYAQRGRALGWLFGGMAGGIAVGAAGGALGQPVLGWPGLFYAAAAAGLVLLLAAVALPVLPATPRPATRPPVRAVAAGFTGLLRQPRARCTYGYVLLNAVVQSGVYTWLGIFVQQRFGLGELGIGLTLLGYGIPGFLFGPLIGRAIDRYGRARIIPAGVALTAACALALAAPLPRLGVQAAIVALSLGYDMTQPPLAGIVTDLPGHRGQATGLNVFTLFTGFGLGSLLYQAALAGGFSTADVIFGGVAAVAAVVAPLLFAGERPALAGPRLRGE